ncbi:VOC family protein [Evansella halocellulosilytica]|uniref:VOC family protein n=1 Tax=Evansella halocellulosilytica TaxID=2011013 RepID=UPI000BB92F32|nr:VOC family protein [Evansella halocellulosilytica]
MGIPNQKITTFITFEGKAEEAMNFYTSLFENSEIKNISRYGANEPGKEGSVRHATFSLNGQEFMCIDSIFKHEWEITPGVSLYVNCKDEAEMNKLFDKLLVDGKALMPLDDYGMSKKFGWVNDRFGVSWQLNLP